MSLEYAHDKTPVMLVAFTFEVDASRLMSRGRHCTALMMQLLT